MHWAFGVILAEHCKTITLKHNWMEYISSWQAFCEVLIIKSYKLKGRFTIYQTIQCYNQKGY